MMPILKITSSLAAIVLISMSCAFSQKLEVKEEVINTKIPILTEESAENKAIEYLGFQKMKDFKRDRNLEGATKIDINNDKTPFLQDQINDCDIWKVTFKDITLSPYRGYPDSVDVPRTFDVYIDPNDGTLLKIESLYSGTNIDFDPEPSGKWAEKWMEGSQERFLGFASPDSDYVSFFDVLNSMGPRNFKQLKAQLVMIPGSRGADPIAVWFVTFRGTDPIIPKSRYGKPYNYISYVYNAKTGNTIAWTIQPIVEFDTLK
ncbi:MAG: hypothetical protein GY865_03570 [candidate division Zixibacteria bacterium]|nr:hypothetical protein [candidate division Zixibacteria bacterium]